MLPLVLTWILPAREDCLVEMAEDRFDTVMGRYFEMAIAEFLRV
jgi:hypothetical protein